MGHVIYTHSKAYIILFNNMEILTVIFIHCKFYYYAFTLE